MKKSWLIVLSCVLLAGLILTGCSGATTSAPATQAPPATKTAAPAPSAAPATTAAPASSAASSAPIKLKFYTNFPPSAGPSQEGQMLADVLAKLSNGRIAMTIYPAEQLGPNSAVLDLLKNGITDMAALGLPPFAKLFPLENGEEVALSPMSNFVYALDERNKLSNGDYGQALAANNLKFISWNVTRPMELFLTKKVVKAEDFKGLKVRSPNPAFIQGFQQFGIVPVAMGLGEVYESLQRGVIDGVVNSPENAVANKWQEVTKFNITQSLGYGSTVMVMSKGTWDSLPPDIQAMFTQAVPQWETQAVAFYKDQETQANTTMKAAGVEIYNLDPTEAARWIQIQGTTVDQWVAKTDAPGVPAKALVDQIRKDAK